VKISIAVNWLPEPAITITASLALATFIAVLAAKMPMDGRLLRR
jgi:hypothetical protein